VDLQPNTKVAFYHQNRLQIGELTAEHQGIFTVATVSDEQVELRAARFVLSGVSAKGLQDFSEAVFRLAAEFQPGEFGFLATTELTFEQIVPKLNPPDPETRFALYFYLTGNPELFNHKKNLFRIKTTAEQESYARQMAELAARQAYLNAVAEFLLGASLSAETQDQLYRELAEMQLEHLHKDLLQLIKAHWHLLSPEDALLQMLYFCGELPFSADPSVARSGLPVNFSDLVSSETLQSILGDPEPVTAFCIDAEDTRDYDDAISISQQGDNWLVGIHVSSVAALLQPDGRLFREARQRVSSLYTPNLVVPMFPACHSERGLSLVKGEVRPCLSLYVRFDAQFNQLEKWLQADTVRIAANLSYREVDKASGAEPYKTLNRLCEVLALKRDSLAENKRSGQYYYLRELAGILTPSAVNPDSPARRMVEELMILYNSSMAEYAVAEGIPVLFRNVQPVPNWQTDSPPVQAYLSTRPEYHPGIGTAAYLHSSSPVRRYVDLLNQMQILAALRKAAIPFTASQLETEIEGIEKRLNLIKETSIGSERYWWLQYLEAQHLHIPLDAYIIQVQQDKIRMELSDWGIQVWVKCQTYGQFGQVKVVFYSVNWSENLLVGELV